MDQCENIEAVARNNPISNDFGRCILNRNARLDKRSNPLLKPCANRSIPQITLSYRIYYYPCRHDCAPRLAVAADLIFGIFNYFFLLMFV